MCPMVNKQTNKQEKANKIKHDTSEVLKVIEESKVERLLFQLIVKYRYLLFPVLNTPKYVSDLSLVMRGWFNTESLTGCA